MRSRPYGAGNETVSRVQSAGVVSIGSRVRSVTGVRSYENARAYAANTSSPTGFGSTRSGATGTGFFSSASVTSAASYLASRNPMVGTRSHADRGSAVPNM